MERIVRSLLIFAIVGSLLAGSAHCARAQDRTEETDSFKLEQALAHSLVELYLTPDHEDCPPGAKRRYTVSDTIRHDAAAALERMGSPAVEPLWARLDGMWKQKDFRNMKRVSTLLGRFGQPLTRTPWKQDKVKDDVRKTLIAIAKFHAESPGDDVVDARQAAIEALGRIYAQKGAFLVIERPEIFRTPGDAKLLAKRLRNATQNLKAKFVQDEKGLEKQVLDPPGAAKIVGLLLDARNLQRTYEEFNDRKLFIFMGELEPAGKEKSLLERTDLAFAEMENNLRTAATGTEIAKKDAWLKANRNAHDLCEEMEHLYVYIMPRWEDERNAFQEVLQAFNEILKDEEARHYEEQFIIRLSISEATKRIYAGD